VLTGVGALLCVRSQVRVFGSWLIAIGQYVASERVEWRFLNFAEIYFVAVTAV